MILMYVLRTCVGLTISIEVGDWSNTVVWVVCGESMVIGRESSERRVVKCFRINMAKRLRLNTASFKGA